jgi:hypothetical protein
MCKIHSWLNSESEKYYSSYLCAKKERKWVKKSSPAMFAFSSISDELQFFNECFDVYSSHLMSKLLQFAYKKNFNQKAYRDFTTFMKCDSLQKPI